MGRFPGALVLRDVDELARRKPEMIEVAHQGAGFGADYLAGVVIEVGQACDGGERVVIFCEEMSDGFKESPFRFAQEHGMETLLQIIEGVIGGVGAVDQDGGAGAAGGLENVEGDFAHSREAHFGEEVEVVFEDDHDAGMVLLESGVKSGFGIVEHGIEDGDRQAGAAQEGGGVKRAERGIRLHFPHLFAVVIEVIGMSEQNVCHVSGPR